MEGATEGRPRADSRSWKDRKIEGEYRTYGHVEVDDPIIYSNNVWQILSQSFDDGQLKTLLRQYGDVDATVAMVNILKKTWAFNGFRILEIGRLLFAMTKVVYQKDGVIIAEGDDAEALYVIEAGSADVYINSKTSDDKRLQLQTLYAGSFVGETALLGNNKRTASLIAREQTTVIRIHRDELARVRYTSWI
jgi:hypothetical protein